MGPRESGSRPAGRGPPARSYENFSIGSSFVLNWSRHRVSSWFVFHRFAFGSSRRGGPEVKPILYSVFMHSKDCIIT